MDFAIGGASAPRIDADNSKVTSAPARRVDAFELFQARTVKVSFATTLGLHVFLCDTTSVREIWHAMGISRVLNVNTYMIKPLYFFPNGLHDRMAGTGPLALVGRYTST